MLMESLMAKVLHIGFQTVGVPQVGSYVIPSKTNSKEKYYINSHKLMSEALRFSIQCITFAYTKDKTKWKQQLKYQHLSD